VNGERLQKVLARAGLGSRRAVERLIADGRVSVNGRAARLGQRIDAASDEVALDGSVVVLEERTLLYLLNKPYGVVTTADDPQRRSTVMDLIDAPGRVWPVGRLDYDSEGALIVTNDGDLTQRLTHPRYEVPKTYVVTLRGQVPTRALARLRSGVELDDGLSRARNSRVLRRASGSSLVEVTLTGGRNREVRRMFDALGYPVDRLVRVAIGPLMLGRLRPGGWRKLRLEEARALYRTVGL
jgi:23S rRNA pseudouridine2605 synthase